MPIPPALRPFLGDRSFWMAYLRQRPFAGGENLDDCRVELSPADGYGLILHFEPPCAVITLLFRHPGASEPVEIGQETEYQSCGNVLRWTELDRICRALALRDPELTHPGVGTLLLLPFAPIRPSDEVAVIYPLLEASLESVFPDDDSEIDDRIACLDQRRWEPDWKPREPFGWYLHVREELRGEVDYFGLSIRDHESLLPADERDHFPHNAWAGLLEATDQGIRGAIDSNWLRGPHQEALRHASTTGDLSGLPRLATALARSDCDLPILLEACRNPSLAARACWVVEEIAGLPPGDLIRRHFVNRTRLQRRYQTIGIHVPIAQATLAITPEIGAELQVRLLEVLQTGAARVTNNLLFPVFGPRRELDLSVIHLHISAKLWKTPESTLEAVRQVLQAAGPPPGTQLNFEDSETGEYGPVPI